MARRNARLDVGGAGGQRQRGLGDVVLGMRLDLFGEGGDLGLGGGRADQHAIAPGAVHLFDHQIGQVLQRIGQAVGLAAHAGGHVVQQRGFAQVELDHARHIGVDGLVVGHPGADGVGQVDVARAVGSHQPGAADSRFGAEHLWVEKVVVNAAVDHVHPLRPLGGAHIDEVVLDEQVLPFHQFHPHLLGDKGVLKIGRVVHARREHHHRGLAHIGRGDGAQFLQQHVRVMRHRRDAVAGEQFGEQPHHHAAVFEHIAHAGGHAQVVFEHEVFALALRVFGAHDVDAGDLRIDVVRQVDAHHLGAELGVAEHLLLRHDAGLEDFLVVIDVVEEAVERGDALLQPGFEVLPFRRGNDARNQVERNEPLGACLVAIHRESDAHAAKDQLGLLALGADGVGRLLRQPVSVLGVVGAHTAVCGGHFVVEAHRRLSIGLCSRFSKIQARQVGWCETSARNLGRLHICAPVIQFRNTPGDEGVGRAVAPQQRTLLVGAPDGDAALGVAR